MIFCKTEDEYKNLIKQYNDEKVATFEKYSALRICYLKDDDWEVFSKHKNRRLYKFWANAYYIREFIKEFDLDDVKKHRWEFYNAKDIQLIKGIEQVYQQLQSLERLERLQSLQSLESLERLQSLESLERLQSLERLESLESLESHNLDYRKVVLPSPSECIIYLDPPYRNTKWYETEFNFEEFDKYVLELKEKWYKIFISEYNLPYWEVIRSKTKRWMISQKKEDMTGKENLYFI